MKAEAFVHRDGTGMFTLQDGTVELVRAATPAAARVEVLRLAAAAAAAAGEVVEVEAILAGERSIIEVAPSGEVGGTTTAAGSGAAPVSETVARNDAQGLLAAGVRPAQLLDADTLACARLRMVEQAGFGAERLPPLVVDPSDDGPTRPAASRVALPSPPAAVPAPPSRGHRRRRPPLIVASAAAGLLLGGTGIALAATGHHEPGQRRAAVGASTTLTAASTSASVPASASTVPASTSSSSVPTPRLAPLQVEVTGGAGELAVRLTAPGATAATVTLERDGAAAIGHTAALDPDGRAAMRLRVPGASYHWSVSTPDGRTEQGEVVVGPAAGSPTPSVSAPPASTTHQLAPTRHVSAKASHRPKPKSTPKPKVHASVPDSPIGREVA